ncbi:hypothetical protein GCM10009077_19410 [Roseibium denhamense]
MRPGDVFQSTDGGKIPFQWLELLVLQYPVNRPDPVGALWMADRRQVIEIGGMVEQKGRHGMLFRNLWLFKARTSDREFISVSITRVG